MVGETFKCCKCQHSFHAGIAGVVETDALPGAQFYDTGDAKGLWLHHNGVKYCGPCSEREFPQILAEGAEFKEVGAVCL